MKRSFALAMRMLRRDWQAGELRVLAAALIVAVTSITAVGFFTDRIHQALHHQANELLGADLLIASDQPVAANVRDLARQHGLHNTETLDFRSMVVAGDNTRLAEIKAVSDDYPLRGTLRTAPQRFAPDAPAAGIPAPGTVWLDAALLAPLNLNVGDAITLGEAQLTVAAVLTHEPARGGDLFSIAPRLMLNNADVPRTQLVQPASRVRYHLLVASDNAQRISAYRAAITPLLKTGERIEGIEDARPELRSALTRARSFLGLAALVSVMLASVAIATATRRFVLRHLDNCAMMRCLGAVQRDITRLYVYQIIVLGLTASLLGCVLGYAAQGVLVNVLGSMVSAELPPPSLWPVVSGLLTGMITLLGFSLPPLLQLKSVSPLRVLRRDIGAPQTSAVQGSTSAAGAGSARAASLTAYGAGITALAALILWQAGEIKLGLYMLGGTTITLLALGAFTVLLMRGLKLLHRHHNGHSSVAWRFGMANITRRAQGSIVQVVGFGIGIMALLLLTLVRGDLLDDWQKSLPADAPNRFLINIQPDQVAPIRSFLANTPEVEKHGEPVLFPMIRGRLSGVNDKSITPENYTDERAQRLVAREFNLSWAADMQADNKIVAGSWWKETDSDKHVISVEEGLATTLGLKLGDSMQFSIAGSEFSATITSLRKVEWDSMHPNFFVLAPPGAFDTYPASFMTSLYVPLDKPDIMNTLVKTFPNVTIIDIAAIMAQIRQIMERVTLAVEYVFMFTLLAGLLVLYAAIQSTLDERIHESAILRTLGARRGQLLTGLFAEFATLGLLAGLVAACAATLLGYVLATQLFHLPYTFNPWLWIIGVAGGTLGVGLAGLLGTLFILRQPPLQTLRNA